MIYDATYKLGGCKFLKYPFTNIFRPFPFQDEGQDVTEKKAREGDDEDEGMNYFSINTFLAVCKAKDGSGGG